MIVMEDTPKAVELELRLLRGAGEVLPQVGSGGENQAPRAFFPLGEVLMEDGRADQIIITPFLIACE